MLKMSTSFSLPRQTNLPIHTNHTRFTLLGYASFTFHDEELFI